MDADSAVRYSALCRPEFLRAAYDRLPAEDRADADGLLRRLADDLTAGTYRPGEPASDLRDRVVVTALGILLVPASDGLTAEGAVSRLADRAGRGMTRAYAVDVTRAFEALNAALVGERLAQRIADPELVGLIGRVLAAGRPAWLADAVYGGIDRVLRQAAALGRAGPSSHLEAVRVGHEAVILADADPAHDWLWRAAETRLDAELAALGFDSELLTAQTVDLSRGERLRAFGVEVRLAGGRVDVRRIGAAKPRTPKDRAGVAGSAGGRKREDSAAVPRRIRGLFALSVRGLASLGRFAGGIAYRTRETAARAVAGTFARPRRPVLVLAGCGLVASVCLLIATGDTSPDAFGEEPAPNMPPGFFLGRYDRGSTPAADRVSYGLYVPPHFKDETGPFPLIVFLHGYGERTAHKIFTVGLPKAISSKFGDHKPGRRFEFAALFPIDPTGYWDADAITATAEVLDRVIVRHNIDRDRVHLTGLSIGANGAWRAAVTVPDRWAAIATVSAYARPGADAVRELRLPVWIVHGVIDRQAPVEAEREFVKTLREVGVDAMYDEVADKGHDVWDRAYADAGLYQWFASKRRRASDKVGH